MCVFDKRPKFGRFDGEILVLGDAGRIVAEEWTRTADIRTEIETDAFVVMPDHFHGILWINQVAEHHTPIAGAYGNTPPLRSPSHTIGAAVRAFKAAATGRIRESADRPDLIVWQRNYYEGVVRDDRQLNALRDYIETNPLRHLLKCKT